MSALRIILASLLSFCKKLSKLVDIWRSSDKNKFAQFFEIRCIGLLDTGCNVQTASLKLSPNKSNTGRSAAAEKLRDDAPYYLEMSCTITCAMVASQNAHIGVASSFWGHNKVYSSRLWFHKQVTVSYSEIYLTSLRIKSHFAYCHWHGNNDTLSRKIDLHTKTLWKRNPSREVFCHA